MSLVGSVSTIVETACVVQNYSSSDIGKAIDFFKALHQLIINIGEELPSCIIKLRQTSLKGSSSSTVEMAVYP